MKKVKIKNDELILITAGDSVDFPRYTTQIMNLANQNAQGTRPKIVGQMSDLIQEFDGKEYSDWVEWYQKKMPSAIDNATEKVFEMVEKLKDAITHIDKELVKEWIKDLLLTKTFIGLCFQGSILNKVAEIKREKYRLATPQEEAKGIDGFIGDKAVSIKPITYKTKNMLREDIKIDMIYYDKKKDGINIFFEF